MSEKHRLRTDYDAVSRARFLRFGASTILGGVGVSNLPAFANGVATQPASVAVFPTLNGGEVRPGLAGLSYEKGKLATNFFSPLNSNLIGCMKRLGPSILRVGGNSADRMSWTPSGSGLTRGQVAPSDVSALGAFLKLTGWKLIYGINLAHNSPEIAADEAAFASEVFGQNLESFEIGNECDDYAHNGIRPSTYDVADFTAEWSSYVAAIRERVSGAPLSGPASAYRLEDWTIPFAASEASKINLLTQHYYQGNGKDPKYTISQLLAYHDFFPRILKKLQNTAAVNKITGGYRLSETNSLYSGGGQNVSNTHGAALWMIDFLLTAAQFGCVGANIHGGGDGTYNPYYTPLADEHAVITEVRPSFYGMLFVSQIAPGSMHTVTVSSSLNLSAFSISGRDGATYLILNNKDGSNVAEVAIDLPKAASQFNELVLDGPGLDATFGSRLGGIRIANDGSWSPERGRFNEISGVSSFSVDVRPASAKLLRIT